MHAWKRLLEEGIKRRTTPRMVVYATHGGSNFLHWVMSTAGVSNFLLEAYVPHDNSACADLLQKNHFTVPSSFCSREVATHLSISAFSRAINLIVSKEGFASKAFVDLFGMSVACNPKSGCDKRGENRAYIATSSFQHGIKTFSLPLEKDLISAEEEDAVISQVMVKAVMDILNRPLNPSESPALPPNLEVEIQPLAFTPETLLQNTLDKKLSHVVYVGAHDVWLPAPQLSHWVHKQLLVFPGSFSPIHEGHEKLALQAAKLKKQHIDKDIELLFEISLRNADKGKVAFDHIYKTAADCRRKNINLLVTVAPLFSEKAKLCSNATFVMGFDTFVRILDPCYYGGKDENILISLAEMKALGCSFIVGGRLIGEAYHCSMEEVEHYKNLPETLRSLFQSVPNFRVDLSSTEIRKKL